MSQFLSCSKIALLFLISIFFRNNLIAQNNQTGSWLSLFNQTRISNKWSAELEVQLWDFDIAKNEEQVFIRSGINYHVNNQLIISSGYAHINNFSFEKIYFSGIQSAENRFWQQLLVKQNFGRLYLDHRFRLEERWMKIKNGTDYFNRLRYFVKLTIPINHLVITKNTFFVSAFNEAFINITDKQFDRNRLCGSLGYQFNATTGLQLGFLSQTTNFFSKNYIQALFTYNLDVRKKS